MAEREQVIELLESVNATFLRKTRHEIWMLPDHTIWVMPNTASDRHAWDNNFSDLKRRVRKYLPAVVKPQREHHEARTNHIRKDFLATLSAGPATHDFGEKLLGALRKTYIKDAPPAPSKVKERKSRPRSTVFVASPAIIAQASAILSQQGFPAYNAFMKKAREGFTEIEVPSHRHHKKERTVSTQADPLAQTITAYRQRESALAAAINDAEQLQQKAIEDKTKAQEELSRVKNTITALELAQMEVKDNLLLPASVRLGLMHDHNGNGHGPHDRLRKGMLMEALKPLMQIHPEGVNARQCHEYVAGKPGFEHISPGNIHSWLYRELDNERLVKVSEGKFTLPFAAPHKMALVHAG